MYFQHLAGRSGVANIPAPQIGGGNMIRSMIRFSILAAGLATVGMLPAHAAETPPEMQGFSPERLNRIASVMKAEIEKGTMPGAVSLISRNGKIVHLEAHGYL